jgi:hypothetical protein
MREEVGSGGEVGASAVRPLAIVVLVALVAACGPKPRPPRQQATGDRQQATGNGNPKPPPGEEAMSEVLEALRVQRDRMCACTDATCVDDAEADQFEWGFTHKELVDRAHGTPEQNKQADTLIEATEACSHKLRP